MVKCPRNLNFEKMDTASYKRKHDGVWLLWRIFKAYLKQNRDLRIEFGFSWITLSSFCEIRESKLSFSWNFCLQGNHKVSVYTSSSKNRLYLTPKSVKLNTIFLHLDNILTPNPLWGAYSAPPTLQLLELLPKSSRITSEKKIRTLYYYGSVIANEKQMHIQLSFADW